MPSTRYRRNATQCRVHFATLYAGGARAKQAATPNRLYCVHGCGRHFEGIFEGTNVKRYACAIVVGLLFGGAVQAAVIDLDDSPGARVRVADLSTVPRNEVVAPPPASMSALPEPEVFAMMLVGLILIGYRASRDSSEKFE